MKSFTVRVSRRLKKALGLARAKIWSDRYHRRDLTSPRQVRNALVYVLANYKKHQRIVTGAPRIDLCSSAHGSCSRSPAGFTIARRQSRSHRWCPLEPGLAATAGRSMASFTPAKPLACPAECSPARRAGAPTVRSRRCAAKPVPTQSVALVDHQR